MPVRSRYTQYPHQLELLDMTAANPPVTPIAFSKTAALSRVIDAVTKGYIFYCTGRCPAGRLQALARKFHLRYGIGCSPAQRLTRKQHEQANAIFVAYCNAKSLEKELPQAPGQRCAGAQEGDSTGIAEASNSNPEMDWANLPSGSEVEWLLLVTKGTGPVHEQESLRCVTDKQRLVYCGYELVRHPVAGRTAWTFRRTKQEMTTLYTLLDSQLKRHRHDEVEATLARISRQPGFSGVREQSKSLLRHAQQHGYPGELPKLFFVQKVKHGIPLSLR